MDLSKDIKKPEYTQYNPNGRIPTLIDHRHNDFVIWYGQQPDAEKATLILYLRHFAGSPTPSSST